MSGAVADVAVSLTIDSSPIQGPDLAAIMDIQVEEGVNLGDALVLVAEIRPKPDGEWATPIDRLCAPAVPVTCDLRSGSFAYHFDGRSAQAEWKKEGTSAPKLTVKALDRSAELDAEEKVAGWSGVSDADIATSIFSKHGLRAQVDATVKALDADTHVVLQRGTDWAFLQSLAEKWGYSVFLESDGRSVVGHFRLLQPNAPPQGELALGMTGSTLALDAKVDLLSGHRVIASRFPPLRRRPDRAEAVGDDQAQGKTSLGGRGLLVLDGDDVDGELTPSDAAKVLARKAAMTLELTAEYVVGPDDTPVRARRPVLVKGLGSTLSGQYDVTRVRHRIEHDRFTQKVTLQRNALGLRGDEPYGRTAGLGLGGTQL